MIGAACRILFDGFADSEFKEGIEENRSHRVRDH
jgi:hypothetical protein